MEKIEELKEKKAGIENELGRIYYETTKDGFSKRLFGEYIAREIGLAAKKEQFEKNVVFKKINSIIKFVELLKE